MTISTHNLATGVSYLDATQLTALLTQLEFYVDVPYADSTDPAKAKATIGIGVNLMVQDASGGYPYLALVLDQLGVFSAMPQINASRN